MVLRQGAVFGNKRNEREGGLDSWLATLTGKAGTRKGVIAGRSRDQLKG